MLVSPFLIPVTHPVSLQVKLSPLVIIPVCFLLRFRLNLCPCLVLKVVVVEDSRYLVLVLVVVTTLLVPCTVRVLLVPMTCEESPIPKLPPLTRSTVRTFLETPTLKFAGQSSYLRD